MTTLLGKYKENRYRKFQLGSDITPEQKLPEKDYGKFSNAMVFGTQLASGILDATAKPDPVSGRLSTGTVVGKSALSGASAGASFGPIGAGVGAVLGAGLGLVQSGKEKREAKRMLSERNIVQQNEDNSRSAALLASDPSLLSGYRNSSYFAAGGSLVDGDDPKPVTPRQLKPEELTQWNQFLDYVKAKGYEGSEELNNRSKALGESLFNDFRKENKNITIGYDIVPHVQTEMTKLRDNARDFAKRHNQAGWEKIMEGISPVDGWFGSKTSQYRFPNMMYNEFRNDSLVKSENIGLVDGSLKSGKKVPATITGKKIPANAKIEKLEDGYYYEDEQTGDLIKVNMADGGQLPSLHTTYMTGGTTRKLSSDSVEFKGNSHEAGGIKLPELRAEVEGKETGKGSYIFSDRLGFAAAHKKLATAKGIIEGKPVTRERINSMRLLNNKENQLIIAQELVRSQLKS